MKYLNIVAVFFIFIVFSSFMCIHKFYISNTQIKYVEDKKSVQIITRVFVDDFEIVLKERYDENLSFYEKDTKLIDSYIEKYLSEKFRIKIDEEHKPFVFVGKKIEFSMVICYLEIKDINKINTIEVTNNTLFDFFSQQQNVIKLDINGQRKSFMLTKQNAKAVLNFE